MLSIRMLVIGMVAFGSLNTVVRKAQMVTCVRTTFTPDPALEAECDKKGEEPFNKPWIGNLFMFMGEMLLIAFIPRVGVVPEPRRETLGDVIVSPELPFRFFAVPAFLDVIGSGLSGVSMLYISASVWQMMRGSLILYTAAISYLYFSRSFTKSHLKGLILATVGLSLVGLSSWLDSISSSVSSLNENSPAGYLTLVGVFLTVGSQLCTAVQVIVEEAMLKMTTNNGGKYRSPSPEKVIACEGIWGCLVMLIILLGMQVTTGDDHGSMENSVDSIEKLMVSNALIFLVLFYLLSIALFNYFGMTVSKHLSSVHRTLIDSSRSVVVWAFQLCMWYVFESKTYGTEWTRNSILQLAGFSFLVCGTTVYNREVPTIEEIPTEETLLRRDRADVELSRIGNEVEQ